MCAPVSGKHLKNDAMDAIHHLRRMLLVLSRPVLNCSALRSSRAGYFSHSRCFTVGLSPIFFQIDLFGYPATALHAYLSRIMLQYCQHSHPTVEQTSSAA